MRHNVGPHISNNERIRKSQCRELRWALSRYIQLQFDAEPSCSGKTTPSHSFCLFVCEAPGYSNGWYVLTINGQVHRFKSRQRLPFQLLLLLLRVRRLSVLTPWRLDMVAPTLVSLRKYAYTHSSDEVAPASSKPVSGESHSVKGFSCRVWDKI
jgi:hypothetical protein